MRILTLNYYEMLPTSTRFYSDYYLETLLATYHMNSTLKSLLKFCLDSPCVSIQPVYVTCPFTNRVVSQYKFGFVRGVLL